MTAVGTRSGSLPLPVFGGSPLVSVPDPRRADGADDSLRILHLAEAWGGGLMEMVLALASGSAACGHEVLIGHGVRPETPADLNGHLDERVELRRLAWTDRSAGAQVAALREIRNLVDEWAPDIVHLHSSFAGVVGALATGNRIPTVWSPNAFASALPEANRVSRPLMRAAERVACRRINVVGAVSASESELAWALGARAVIRVRNGIRELDPEFVRTRSAYDPAPDPPRVVATGRTVPQRKPAACARILGAIRDVAEVEWLGGGGGRRGDDGRAALSSAGIPASGWLPRDELLDRVGSASAYLHWTAWDGLPLSILEAMALDVVVIASDIPPNREILGPDAVYKTEDEAIAALRRVVEDPDYAEELRVAQRARRAGFSAERMVDGWHEVYDRLQTRDLATAGALTPLRALAA